MLDRVTSMQVFAKVASLGSLSAAARTLGMSQTMATKHIGALEARLGSKLLHRTTRRLTLTDIGRGYLEACERILEEIANADDTAAAATVDVRGLLRLSAPYSFGVLELAHLLPEFSRLHPALVIDLGLNDRHVDLIEEGWDLAVRIGSLPASSLQARRLAPCRMLVCAAPAYLARHGVPTRMADLRQHNCLGYTLSRTVGAAQWSFGREGRTSVEVKGTLKANNGDALMAAAVAGQGIVYQPSFLLARHVRAGRLQVLGLDHETIQTHGIHAVYPADRKPPAKLRTMIDYLAAAFSPPPWEAGL